MLQTNPANIRQLLERALTILNCPACAGEMILLPEDGPLGVRCDACERDFAFTGGILNLYVGPEFFTLSQRSLQSRLSTALYERFRWLLAKVVIGYTAQEEVEHFERTLNLQAGDTLLDVACGPGNFTLPLARRANPGLVIGLDISPAQLARAANNLARTGLSNVLFIRGDVHKLPLKDAGVCKVNCAGGLHQFPDPAKALAEVARVLPTGGRFSGSTFARHTAPWAQQFQAWMRKRSDCHFVDLGSLRPLIERAGLADYRHMSAPKPWFGYYQAAKV